MSAPASDQTAALNPDISALIRSAGQFHSFVENVRVPSVTEDPPAPPLRELHDDAYAVEVRKRLVYSRRRLPRSLRKRGRGGDWGSLQDPMDCEG
jgi:hypothetical protein